MGSNPTVDKEQLRGYCMQLYFRPLKALQSKEVMQWLESPHNHCFKINACSVSICPSGQGDRLKIYWRQLLVVSNPTVDKEQLRGYCVHFCQTPLKALHSGKVTQCLARAHTDF